MLARDTQSYFKEILQFDQQIGKDAAKSTVIDIRDLKIELPTGATLKQETRVEVVDADSFDVARALIAKGCSTPLVLNLASDFCPGGGWRKGSMAQEESLFYRSTYDLSLNSRQGLCNVTYPLKRHQVVYSPGVFVFRDHDYKLLPWKECFKVDCLAVAAIRNPRLTRGQLNEADMKTTQSKIDAIFQIARDYKYEHLVLAALGCGAFHNPPKDIATLFKQSLQNCGLSSVTFAVLSTKSTENYRIFRDTLTIPTKKEKTEKVKGSS